VLDSEARYCELLVRLKARHYRMTPQRLALLHVIATSEAHPSAAHLYEQVQAQFPDMSCATVYKTVNVLKEMGEVLELGFSDDDNRFDGRQPTPHPHLICTHCRKIVDLEAMPVAELTSEMARRTGFEILSHRLDFYGLCPDCRPRQA
jgi:Fur family transcriptional regulator, peroxide stress response regulator